MPQWLQEERFIHSLLYNRKLILYIDNCTGHNDAVTMLSAAGYNKTEIRYLPKNVTNLVHNCDSFIIQK